MLFRSATVVQALAGCLSCNPDLRTAIVEHRFALLLLTVGPLTVAGGFLTARIACLVVRVIEHGRWYAQPHHLAWAAALMGAGAGGLGDSIVLHQVLQVHDMISNSLPPVTLVDKGVNVFWSGVFDLAALVVLLLGIASFWRYSRRFPTMPSRFFWGALLFGAGGFTCFDVMVFHALLRYHDLVEASAASGLWNTAWWLVGAVTVVVGIVLIRSGLRLEAVRRASGP